MNGIANWKILRLREKVQHQFSFEIMNFINSIIQLFLAFRKSSCTVVYKIANEKNLFPNKSYIIRMQRLFQIVIAFPKSCLK